LLSTNDALNSTNSTGNAPSAPIEKPEQQVIPEKATFFGSPGRAVFVELLPAPARIKILHHGINFRDFLTFENKLNSAKQISITRLPS
jgi:hypothetical protein